MERFRVLPLLLCALALLAAACNGGADVTTGDEEPGTHAGYNDADITFLQQMIPHHEQAVEMAELVPDRTERTELIQLAEDIVASQQAEIAEMERMLAEAGASDEREGHDMEEMDDTGTMEDMEGMEGMMREEDMTRLAGLQGTEFDLLFLDMMVAHHEGAIVAAERVIEGGENPGVGQLAEGIIAEQQAEIDQMTAWRGEWGSEAR
ncbi:MAG TPA: DUF305 domain-containing protein [Egibacteraceae bacterium]|nr:DUF305 domain-containing protein [Egibacteraceae bacterium]